MSEPVVHLESYKFGKAVENMTAGGLSTLAAIAHAAHESQERQDRIAALTEKQATGVGNE